MRVVSAAPHYRVEVTADEPTCFHRRGLLRSASLWRGRRGGGSFIFSATS